MSNWHQEKNRLFRVSDFALNPLAAKENPSIALTDGAALAAGGPGDEQTFPIVSIAMNQAPAAGQCPRLPYLRVARKPPSDLARKAETERKPVVCGLLQTSMKR